MVIVLGLLSGCSPKPSSVTEVVEKPGDTEKAKAPEKSSNVEKTQAPEKTGGLNKSGAKKSFLDQKMEVPPRKEWNKEVGSRKGGTFTFRISSQGPFSVTVVSEKGYKALLSKQKFDKKEILFILDSKEPTLEKSLTIPAGSSWFIIENQTDKKAEIHLECFTP